MKVLHVITSMDPLTGGPCSGLRNLIPELLQMGFYSEVLCMDNPEATYIQDDPFVVHALGPGKTAWAYRKSMEIWLNQHLAGYTAVVLHGIWQYPNLAVWRALKTLRKKSGPKVPKLLVMPHGMMDPYFQKAQGRKWKALRNYGYWWVVQRSIMNGANALLYTCQQEQHLARKSFPAFAPKSEVCVGYGIRQPPKYNSSMRSALDACCPAIKGKKYYLFLSRIHEKKGLDLLLHAYADQLMLATDPNNYPCLLVAGPGMDRPYGRQLQAIVDHHPALQQKVFFCGMLEGPAKWGALYHAEAFVLSSHQENFGVAVVEALACGRPVLISKEVNIYQEIEAAGAGFAESDNLKGTIRLLQRWQQATPQQKMAMQQAALAVYHAQFSVGATARLFAPVLQKDSPHLPEAPALCNPSTTTPIPVLPSPAATGWQG